jgi:hypothetical protein
MTETTPDIQSPGILHPDQLEENSTMTNVILLPSKIKAKQQENLPVNGRRRAAIYNPDCARKLLQMMAEAPRDITRTEARRLLSEAFGSAALRHVPTGKGSLVLRLPDSDNVLELRYAPRAPRFHPSRVRGQVHRNAVRIVLPSRFRSGRLAEALLRVFRQHQGGGLNRAA